MLENVRFNFEDPFLFGAVYCIIRPFSIFPILIGNLLNDHKGYKESGF